MGGTGEPWEGEESAGVGVRDVGRGSTVAERIPPAEVLVGGAVTPPLDMVLVLILLEGGMREAGRLAERTSPLCARDISFMACRVRVRMN